MPKIELKNKKILITGGAGFIGSNLVDALIANNEVVVLDNLITGKVENINHHFSKKNFTFVEGDIRDLKTCQKASESVDYVFHQAALGSVPRSINDPLTTNEINITGFLNMLTAARDSKTKRFIYAASSSTYGDSLALPKIENQIGKPLSPYAITKYVNELYADVYSRLYDVETIGLRYFNVFGERQDPNGAYAAAIPLFIKNLINKIPPTINGDGNITRDFTYIDNVIQANILAATTTNANAINQVYNVAYGKNITLNQLIQILKDSLSRFDPSISDVYVKYGPKREGDIQDSLADIAKIKSHLGYKPEFSVTQGIEKAIEWYWSNI
jgi:UDP-N-acetylglucosamine 4-epimerase